MDNPFIEQSQKHAIADLKGLNIQILWRLSAQNQYTKLNIYLFVFFFPFISADDDLDAIAMHDIGPDRMVQHHHAHREHRLHSREFGTFSPIFIENLYRQLDIESQIRNPVLYVHLSMTDVVNEEEEGPKVKERLLALSLKYLDVCCVWDCSPY